MKQKKKTINDNLELYLPTEAQRKIHLSPFQFNVVCFGRQSGKSTYGINKLLQKAWPRENGLYWYVGPTYRLANQMYERTMVSLMKSGAMKDKSDSELFIELLSGSRIYYKSGDNPGALLGETLDGAIIDECREQKKEIWFHYIQPMLGTTGGWADFLSTPNGFDWFYDIYQNTRTRKNWGAFHAPSTSNPFWSKEMIQEAKEGMSEDLFAQEILAEFRDVGSGSVYVTFSQENIRDTSPFALLGQEISPHLPILVGLDFNLSPMSWCLGQTRAHEFYWHDEMSLNNSHTQEASQVLIEKVRGHKPGVILIGDASGNAGQRAAAGQSDYDIVKKTLKDAGITYTDKTPDSNPQIKDRINAVNALHKSANGNVSCWYHPRCKMLIKDRQRRSWKTGATSLAFDNSDPTIGHMADACDYPMHKLAPIKSSLSVGTSKVIHRVF